MLRPLQKRPGLHAVFEWHFAGAIMLVACFLNTSEAYVTPTSFRRALQTTRSTLVFQKSTDYYEPIAETGEPLQTWDRRSAITTILSPLVLLPLGATAETEPLPQKQLQDFDCLCDLPQVPSDCVRVFLCRHGQTENNRLRKVQGARVDPPINDNGILQAQSVGKALARTVPGPKLIVHSKLLRARMTAEVAAEQMGPTVDTSKVLEELGEVDFGPVAEGQSIFMAMAGMTAAYAAWALGDIDYRPAEGGDSCREVLGRAAEALRLLAQDAKSSNGCVAAVSHSTYLRMLLSMILDEPLRDSAARSIVNGGITVVDIQKDGSARRLTAQTTKLFTGGRAPADFDLEIPICTVVRVNEARHLPLV